MGRGMFRKIKISLNYYRAVAPFDIAITGLCAWLLYMLKNPQSIPLLILFKLLMLIVSLYWEAKLMHPHQEYYYHNLEISRRLLWTVTATVALALFTLVLVFTEKLLL